MPSAYPGASRPNPGLVDDLDHIGHGQRAVHGRFGMPAGNDDHFLVVRTPVCAKDSSPCPRDSMATSTPITALMLTTVHQGRAQPLRNAARSAGTGQSEKMPDAAHSRPSAIGQRVYHAQPQSHAGRGIAPAASARPTGKCKPGHDDSERNRDESPTKEGQPGAICGRRAPDPEPHPPTHRARVSSEDQPA